MGNKNKYFILIYSYGTGFVWGVVTVGKVVIGCIKSGCGATFNTKTFNYAITIRQRHLIASLKSGAS